MKNIFLTIVCILPAGASVFSVGRWFCDYMITPKWYGMLILLSVSTIILCIWRISVKGRGLSSKDLFIHAEKAIIAVCTLQAALMLSQHYGLVPKYGIHTSGSFDNAAGLASCMALGIPVALRRIRNAKVKERSILAAYILLCTAAIIHSGSRTGMLCIAVLGCAILCRMMHIGHAAIIPVAIITTAVSALCMKTDSSCGRWFILQRTAELIWKNPVMGSGTGAFDREYMNIQAEYFKNNPDSRYSMLADNIHHPLNEFMLAAADFGLVGVAVLAAMIVFTVYYAKNNRTGLTSTGMQILTVIILFSMFSYPFLYPFTWLMLATALYCIFGKNIRFGKTAGLICLTAATIGGTYIICKAKTDFELQNIIEMAQYKPAGKCVPLYKAYYKKQKDDYSYLYSLAVMQFDAGLYNDALKTAEKCSKLFADYDLSLLFGDINRELGNQSAAISGYRQAHLMCPSRIMPLYETYLIYRHAKDSVQRKRMAKIILNKPIKIRSGRVNMMIDDIKAYEELESNRFFRRERITLNELSDSPMTHIMSESFNPLKER